MSPGAERVRRRDRPIFPRACDRFILPDAFGFCNLCDRRANARRGSTVRELRLRRIKGSSGTYKGDHSISSRSLRDNLAALNHSEFDMTATPFPVRGLSVRAVRLFSWLPS